MHLKRLFVNKAHSASCDVYSYIVQNCMPWHENILILIQRQGSRPCTHTSLWQLRCVSWGIDNRRACLKIETDNVLLGIWKVFKKRHNDENNDVSMNIVPNCSSLLDFKMPAPKSLIWGAPETNLHVSPKGKSCSKAASKPRLSTVLSRIQPGSTISPLPPGSDISLSS